MADKSEHIQIRVSAHEKARLRRLADRAGLDLSSYILARAMSTAGRRAQDAIDSMRRERDRSFALAELSDALAPLSGPELLDATADLDVDALPDLDRNYATATVEYLCAIHGVEAPAWTRAVRALATPWFATTLSSLRVHLLRHSPVAFRRRNLFVDSGPDARV